MSRFSAAIPLVAVAFWFVACAGPSDNRVLSEVPAPSGNKAAMAFERSCGATTGFSTHVTVVKEFGQLRKTAGNVFAADNANGAAKDMTVTVRWVEPDKVVIRYPAQA